MRTVVMEGATVDEAIAGALGTLGIAREEAEVEIVHEGGAGVPGGSGRKALVRVTVREARTVRPAAREAVRAEPRGTEPEGRAPAARNADRPVSRETSAPLVVDEARVAQAREVVGTVLEAIGGGHRVRVEDGDDPSTINLVIEGGDAGVVIGHHGQTLDAIEHVVNRIVFRDHRPSDGRVTVDIEGYRSRREEQLTERALRLAERVRESGGAVDLDPMSARDRRTIHLALRNEPGVTTASEGEGYERHVVIFPESGSRRSGPRF